MSNRLEEIARRKQALIERCAAERSALHAAWSQIRSPFHVTTTLVTITRMLKTYPLLAAGVSSLLVSGYGSKLTRSAGELVKLWRLVLPVWAWFTKRGKR